MARPSFKRLSRIGGVQWSFSLRQKRVQIEDYEQFDSLMSVESICVEIEGLLPRDTLTI